MAIDVYILAAAIIGIVGAAFVEAKLRDSRATKAVEKHLREFPEKRR